MAATVRPDLEKRQHAFASGQRKPIQPSFTTTESDSNAPMAGGWQDKKAL